jgi:pseudouridine-5'-monophosphatase
VADLLCNLTTKASPPVRIALASSAGKELYNIKISHIRELADAFPNECRVFGDDPAMAGREKKPAPDIFCLAMGRLNEAFVANGEPVLKPEECLVFEDSIAGVEAGRRAGMQVVWVPHAGLAKVCRGREQEVLLGKTEDSGTPTFNDAYEEPERLEREGVISEDGRARMLQSLESFPYEEYGIKLQ